MLWEPEPDLLRLGPGRAPEEAGQERRDSVQAHGGHPGSPCVRRPPAARLLRQEAAGMCSTDVPSLNCFPAQDPALP